MNIQKILKHNIKYLFFFFAINTTPIFAIDGDWSIGYGCYYTGSGSTNRTWGNVCGTSCSSAAEDCHVNVAFLTEINAACKNNNPAGVGVGWDGSTTTKCKSVSKNCGWNGIAVIGGSSDIFCAQPIDNCDGHNVIGNVQTADARSNCTKCNTNGGYIRYASGYTTSSTNQYFCKKIDAKCNLSDGLSKCNTCESGYYLKRIEYSNSAWYNDNSNHDGDICFQQVPNCLDTNLSASGVCGSVADSGLCNTWGGTTTQPATCSCNQLYTRSADGSTCIRNNLNCELMDTANPTKCATCETGYTLQTDGQCLRDYEHCDVMEDNATCSKCDTGYTLATDKKRCYAIQYCTDNVVDQSDKCNSCMDGFKLRTIGSMWVCQADPPECNTFDYVSGNLTCTSCVNTMGSLTTSNTCIKIDNCAEYNNPVCAAGGSCTPNAFPGTCKTCKTNYTPNTGTNGSASATICYKNIDNCNTLNLTNGTCNVCLATGGSGSNSTAGYTLSADKKSCYQIGDCDTHNTNTPQTCTTCATGAPWDNNYHICVGMTTCLTPNPTDSNKCIVCNDNYTLTTLKNGCYPISNCTDNNETKSNFCDACTTGSHLSLKPNGDQICEFNDTESCLNYDSQGYCDVCDTNEASLVNKGTPNANCSKIEKCEIYDAEGGTCSKCEGDYYTLPDKKECKMVFNCIGKDSNGLCVKCNNKSGDFNNDPIDGFCPQKTLYCATFDINGCIACENGYTITDPGTDNAICEKTELASETKSMAEGIISNLITLSQAVNFVANDGIDRALQSLDYEEIEINNELATFRQRDSGDNNYNNNNNNNSNSKNNNNKNSNSNNSNSNKSKSNPNSNPLVMFATADGGFSRYNTGSHIDISSYNALMGVAFKRTFGIPNLMTAIFANYGSGNYTTYNDNITASGDTNYVGGGIMAHYKYAPNLLLNNIDKYVEGNNSNNKNSNNTTKYNAWFYTDLSLSGGVIKNNYKPDKIYRIIMGTSTDPVDTSFNFKTNYIGGHIGQGYIIKFNDDKDSKLNFDIKFLYANMFASDVLLNSGDLLETDPLYTAKIVLGLKYKRNFNVITDAKNSNRNGTKNSKWLWSWILGAHYEYEMNGDSVVYITPKDTNTKLKTETPTLRGSTYIGSADINLNYNNSLVFGLGGEGFYGLRTGYRGNFMFKYIFGKENEEIKYDKQGKIIEVKYDNSGNVTEVKYDKFGGDNFDNYFLYGLLTPAQRKDRIDDRVSLILQEQDECYQQQLAAKQQAKQQGKSTKQQQLAAQKLQKNNKQTKQTKKKKCYKPVINIINTKNITDIRKSDKELAIIEKNAITFMNMELAMDKFGFNKIDINNERKKYIRYVFMTSICPLKNYTLCNKDTKAEKQRDKSGFLAKLRDKMGIGGKGGKRSNTTDPEIIDKKGYNDFTIIITGHGDHIGTDKVNKKVGLLRAQETKKEFIKLGVPANKIIISTFGEIYPVFEDERMRDRNRRVDVWVRVKR